MSLTIDRALSFIHDFIESHKDENFGISRIPPLYTMYHRCVTGEVDVLEFTLPTVLASVPMDSWVIEIQKHLHSDLPISPEGFMFFAIIDINGIGHDVVLTSIYDLNSDDLKSYTSDLDRTWVQDFPLPYFFENAQFAQPYIEH